MCAFELLKQWNRIKIFNQLGLGQSLAEFRNSRINWRIFFFSWVPELLRLISALFHSMTVYGKNKFLKKLFYVRSGSTTTSICRM